MLLYTGKTYYNGHGNSRSRQVTMEGICILEFISCYAVCRNTPDGIVEDADICFDILDAYISAKYYRKMGYDVWLEPRHVCVPVNPNPQVNH